MNKEELVSVIVPVYKVEKYIYKCVNSIINQDYKNLEIILVDDGSPDNCPKICDEYAKKDLRIKVIHKKNGGLSDARNAGMDNATGVYTTFIDSDDYVENNYISVLVNIKNKYNCDVSTVEYIKENVSIPKSTYSSDETVVLNSKLSIQAILNGRVNKKYAASTCIHGKLFNTIHIKKHKFKVGVYYEDVLNLFEIYNDIKNMAFNNSKLYHYVQRNDSIVHSKIKVDSFNILYDYLFLYYNLSNDASMKYAIINRIFNLYLEFVFIFLRKNNISDYIFISRMIKKYFFTYFIKCNNTIKRKIAITLAIASRMTAYFYLYVKTYLNNI